VKSLIHVKIYGVPADISQEVLVEVEKSLKFNITIANKTKIPENQILISFIKDELETRSKTVIVAEVIILSENFGTSKAVRNDLAYEIRGILFSRFDNAYRILCSVKPFDKKVIVSSTSR
jgi:hypothetical protein